MAIALAGNPASDVERSAARLFAPYAELTGLASVHRYYAPAPPPTPVLTATIDFGSGDTKSVRVPDRSTRPRLRYQRQLALAYHLFSDYQRSAHGHGIESERSTIGASYARHLLSVHPDARAVTLRVQEHLTPDLVSLRERESDRAAFNPDDARFFTVPEIVGEYDRSEVIPQLEAR